MPRDNCCERNHANNVLFLPDYHQYSVAVHIYATHRYADPHWPREFASVKPIVGARTDLTLYVGATCHSDKNDMRW